MTKTRLVAILMRSGEFERSFVAEQAIRLGHVTVNEEVVKNPNFSFRSGAVVKLDGRKLEQFPFVYAIFNKKAGVVCQKTSKDKTIYDDIAAMPELDAGTKRSLFCVGRLDRDTEGLIIVTNDGRVERAVTKQHVKKTYDVDCRDPVTDKEIATLKRGVRISDDDTGREFFVTASSARRLGERRLELVIDEGRKRQVKKMLLAVGNEVTALRRVAIGKLRLYEVDFGQKDYVIVDKRALKLGKPKKREASPAA
jgi:16S rRNA pseudouridine516 synthase